MKEDECVVREWASVVSFTKVVTMMKTMEEVYIDMNEFGACLYALLLKFAQLFIP